MPPYNENQENQPRVVRIPTLAYPVTVQQAPNSDHTQCYEEIGWHPINVLDLKKIKEIVTS